MNLTAPIVVAADVSPKTHYSVDDDYGDGAYHGDGDGDNPFWEVEAKSKGQDIPDDEWMEWSKPTGDFL